MLIPPGYCEVTLGWRQLAGYREAFSSIGFTIASWDEDVEPLFNDWALELASWGLPSAFRASRVVVKVGTSDPSAPITFEHVGDTGGSGSASMATPQVSIMFSKRTNRGGRKGRGRMFLPPPPEAQVSDVGQLDSTYRSNIDSSFNNMIDAFAGVLASSDPRAVLLHSDATTPDTITLLQAEPLVATQRRRLVRGSL